MNMNKNKRSKLHNAIRTRLGKIPSSRRNGFRFRKRVAVPPTARAQPRYRFEATRELMICFGWLRLFRTILSRAERARRKKGGGLDGPRVMMQPLARSYPPPRLT